MRALATAPPALSPGERARLQRRHGRRLLSHLRVRLTTEGLDNLPQRPHVIVALHEGVADPMILTQLPLAMRFVAREEIFGWPWIGPAIRHMRHIAVDPERGAASYRSMLTAAAAASSAGEHVVMFPQGTVLGIETAFQPGAFRLARALEAPILPVVLTGSHRIWEHPFSPTLRYGEVVAMVVLPPVPAAEVRACGPENVRSDLQRRMKSIALAPSLPAPRRYVPGRDGFWDGYAFEIDPEFPQVLDAVQGHRGIAGVPASNRRRALAMR